MLSPLINARQRFSLVRALAKLLAAVLAWCTTISHVSVCVKVHTTPERAPYDAQSNLASTNPLTVQKPFVTSQDYPEPTVLGVQKSSVIQKDHCREIHLFV